jgi:hypothetical protein
MTDQEAWEEAVKIYETTKPARQLEAESRWTEAAIAWEHTYDRGAGTEYCRQQAKTCRFIAAAIAKGDEFRATFAKMVEEHPQIKEHYLLHEAYERVYHA